MSETRAIVRETEYRTRFFLGAHVVPLYVNMLLASMIMFSLVVYTTAAASIERLGGVTAVVVAFLCAVSTIIALAETLPFRQQEPVTKPALRSIVLALLIIIPFWHMITNTQMFLHTQAREGLATVSFSLPVIGQVTTTIVDLLAVVIVIAPTIIIAMVINLHRVDPFKYRSLLSQWYVISARERDAERAIEALNAHAAYILAEMVDLRPGHTTITNRDREVLRLYQQAMQEYNRVVAQELQAVGIYVRSGEPINMTHARNILTQQQRQQRVLPDNQSRPRRSTIEQEFNRRRRP